MKYDQITALAREYAEWITDVPKANELPNCLMNEAHTLIAENAECMLQWLLRRFCLVEKSKVAKEYKAVAEAVEAYRTQNLVLSRTKLAKADLLITLFPEIAKEVEE